MLPKSIEQWFEQFKEARYIPSCRLLEEKVFTTLGKRLIIKYSSDGIYIDDIAKRINNDRPWTVGLSYDELFPNKEISKDFVKVLFKELQKQNPDWKLELCEQEKSDDFSIHISPK